MEPIVLARDVEKYDATIESIGMFDHSLEVAMGVHYGLFAATIVRLGSAEQRERWLPGIADYSMPGCFALTELGHGSNVRGIETTATFDLDSGEFVLHSPTETAQKYWIGGAAEAAKWTTAFAQLYIRGENLGVHPFVIRIRDENHAPSPGVTIADCGHKCGLNGVDNGRIWFDQVRIPHDQMLSGLSSVSRDGTYTSVIKNSEQRFSAQLAALTGGRVSIVCGSNNQAKIGLATALKYAISRKAFGPPGREEVPLLYYQSHQIRLMPALATTCVLSLGSNKLKQMWYACKSGVSREVHVLSAGYKALATMHMRDALQVHHIIPFVYSSFFFWALGS